MLKINLSRKHCQMVETLTRWIKENKHYLKTFVLKCTSKMHTEKLKIQEEIIKTDSVCMRENYFYVDTVHQFCDRHYEYEVLTRQRDKRVREAKDTVTRKDTEDRALVYDSLQIAHKFILNSFYSYFMRK